MLIPTLIVQDIAEAIAFYTTVLDFRFAFALPDQNPFYAGLTRGVDELHLALHSGSPRQLQCSVIVVCEDVDALFASFKTHGLPISSRSDSPVHMAPVDQSWGTREVYIDDPSGNTLIFQQR